MFFYRMMLRLETSLLLLVCLAMLFCSTEARGRRRRGPMRPPRRPYHRPVHYPVHNDHGGDDTAVVVPGTDSGVGGSSFGGQDNVLYVGVSDDVLSGILQVTLFICQTKYTLHEEKIHWSLISRILQLLKYNTVVSLPNQHFMCCKSDNIRDSNSQPCDKQPF